VTALRVLICDDEPLALDRLSDLLGQCAGVETVGAVQSGREALDAIAELQPDLLMVDIEMPRMDGFDLVEALLRRGTPDTEPVPLICFVTAYPQFATEAFESGALDFLSKPVRLARLEKTIDRARHAIEQREAVRRLRELSEQLDSLRRTSRPDEDRSIWVHRGGEMVRIDIDQLDWLEAEGEYVRLHVGERTYLLRAALSALAERLAATGFVRIHRSAIVNTNRLAAVRRMRGGAMKVSLVSGVELPVGRRFRSGLQAIFSRED
jgi:DNA-binding LytR/AlgR family response regulator